MLKIGDRVQKRDRAQRAAETGTKERESEGREVVLVMLLKLLVKDKHFTAVNAELRPPRREKRGMEVRRYGTLNEAMKI